MKKLLIHLNKQPTWVKLAIVLCILIVIHLVINREEFINQFMNGLDKWGIDIF